jgi:hypothetical protein
MYVKIIIVIMEVLVTLIIMDMQNVNVQLIMMEFTVKIVTFFKYIFLNIFF